MSGKNGGGAIRARALIHIEHERLGLIRPSLEARGIVPEETRLWAGEELPAPGSFDFLIVMGGAMNVDQDADYPWLAAEKTLIRRSIDAGVAVLGICLGAQLIARALGARVAPMGYKEIGWFPVRPEFTRHPLFPDLHGTETLGVAHWHGDAFELPGDCDRLFSSEACREQGFVLRGHPVVALQFHLELDEAALEKYVAEGSAELAEGGRWVQEGSTMLGFREEGGAKAALVLNGLLGSLIAGIKS
jgi:GMP synthase-like glutamine amidotransferase